MAFLPALVSTSSLADPFVANTSPSQLQCQTTWILPQISRPHSPPGTVSGDASPSSSKRSIRRYKSREVDSYEKDLDVTIDDLLDHESTSPSSSSSFPPSTLSSGHSLEAGQLFSCINLGDDKASSASDFDYCTASPVFDSTLLAQMMYHFQIAQDIYPASAVLFLGNLPAHFTDLQLCLEIDHLCDTYGPHAIKVDRHYTKQHVKPYAYVQFSTSHHARKAKIGLLGTHIGGREVRVAQSEARRSLSLRRLDGSMPSACEVAAAVGSFGMYYMRKDYARCARVVEFVCFGAFLRAKQAVSGDVVRGWEALLAVV